MRQSFRQSERKMKVRSHRRMGTGKDVAASIVSSASDEDAYIKATSSTSTAACIWRKGGPA